MVTPKQMKRLATNPADYMRFVTTGKLPEGVRPQSPLIDLLNQLGARERQHIVGLTIDSRLGYEGRRTFHTAEQAMHWLAPSTEVFGTFPAESWRNKRFSKRLYLEDLLECATSASPDIGKRNPRLCRPAPVPRSAPRP